MMPYSASDISRAIAAICPDIQNQTNLDLEPSERVFWWEVSTCILSSQVPYSIAVEASNVIDRRGTLHESSHNESRTFRELYDILSTPICIHGHERRYRFPETRARQLSKAHEIICATSHSPVSIFKDFQDATEARTWLVDHIPGIGPKQASMLLRNIGVSYDLAILDRHVLNYMSSIGIYSEEARSISGLRKYNRYESILRDHANELSCPVGIFDWAIWIVMRVVNGKLESLRI